MTGRDGVDGKKDGKEPGFRVVDRRGWSDEERGWAPVPPPAGSPPPPQPPPQGAAPSRPEPSAGAAPSEQSPATSPAPAAPPPGEGTAPPAAGNRPPPEGVEPGKRPGAGARRESRLGPPGFADLVAAFQVPAMIHLGLMAPPGSGGRPMAPNLPAAKDVIDMLGVLQEKTKGNLDPREEELLTGLLYELRMTYLEIVNAVTGAPGGSHP